MKLTHLINDIVLSTEFWYGFLSCWDDSPSLYCFYIHTMCFHLVWRKYRKFVGISLAIEHISITEIAKFHIISRCENRFDLFVVEDPNSETIGYSLHATGYFCHPVYRGMILSSVLECHKIARMV